jgi:membrane protease YdiL (CAAX protease family)
MRLQRLPGHEVRRAAAELGKMAAEAPRRVSVPAALAVSGGVVIWGNGVVLVQRRLGGSAGEVITLAAHPTAGLIALAILRLRGWHGSDLGLSPKAIAPRGRWGALLVILVAALSAFGFARGGMCREEVTLRLSLVRLLVGTALGEELVHRGLMPAIWTATRSSPLGVLVANAATFGAWHVAGAWAKPWPARIVEVGVPTLLGAPLFLWARLRTGGVSAPTLLHAAVNLPGLIAGCRR